MKINTWFSLSCIHNLYAFRRTVLCVLINACLCSSSFTQANNIGNLYISGNVYLDSSFTNQATATYQNDGTFYLAGDFINNQAAIAEGTGTTEFIGDSLQKIGGTQTTVFHHVHLNNPNGVQMNLNATMNGTISTDTGSLYFNGYALTMGGKISAAHTNVNAFSVTPTSDLIINGKAANGNSLYFDSFAHTLHDLTVSNGASGVLGDSLNIVAGTSHGTVIVDGNFNASGFLTLKSDSGGTSRIGQSSGDISGFVTVERYIPPRRAWRFLSVPVNNDTLHIRTAWQEGVNNTDPTLNYANNQNPHPGFGTHITWDNNTSLGYDYHTTLNASLKTWIQSTNSWSTTTPPTVLTLINDYDGYCIFVRGSRAVDLALGTSAPADPTVLRITGTVNNHAWSKTFSGINSSTILLAKNPYASDVNIASMLTSSTGIENNKFWVWDPAIGGTAGVGGYVTYSNGVMTPRTPNYDTATTIIQNGQAFLVQSNSTSATLNFKQGYKIDSQKTSIFGKQMVSPRPVIYTNLLAPSGSTLALVDGIATAYGSNFSKKINGEDADKLWNFEENIAQVRDGKTFAIQFRPMPQLTDTIFYQMYLAQHPYTLEIRTKNFAAIPTRAWIVDKYLNTATEIALNDDTVLYNFQPNPDTNSYRNRFMLVFNRQFIGTPVPVGHAINHTDSTASDEAGMAASMSNVSVFPNPVATGEKVVLKFNNIGKGSYEVVLFSLKGQKLLSKKIDHNGGNNTYNIRLPLSMAAGTYNLRVVGSNGINVKNTSLMISGDRGL